jgi:hypothetical protein
VRNLRPADEYHHHVEWPLPGRGVSGLSSAMKRLEALKRSVGAACQKCAGVLTTFVNGELLAAMRHGQPMGTAERAEFESASTRCPGCGARFAEMRVPSES